MNILDLPVCTGQAYRKRSSQLENNLPSSSTILLAEDEPHLRRIYNIILSNSGYQVEVARNGREAWDKLQLSNFDLLITDHQMDEMSGLDLIKELHSFQISIPTILISGNTPFEELNKCPWLRMEAFLLKPFKPADLVNTVKDVILSNSLQLT